MKERSLYLILIAVFVASISYSFYYQVRPTVDAGAYDAIGWNLARGCGYVEKDSNCGNPAADDAIGRVGPGYEFFLAANYYVFGHKIWIIWIWHALLRIITAFFIYKISLLLFKAELFKEKIVLAAVLLFGFSPDLILMNGLLLIETFFLAIFTAAIYFSLLAFEDNRSRYVLFAGFLLAFSIMIRPTPLLILVLLLSIFLWQKNLKKAFLLLIFPILIITPWALRNWNLYNHVVLTSSTGGYDLWVGNNPEATGGFDKTQEIADFKRTYGIIVSDRRGWTEYFNFIKSEPLKFIDLQYEKAAYYFSLLRPTGFWPFLDGADKVLTLALSGVWTLVLFAFGIAGLIWVFREGILEKKPAYLLFSAFAILQPLSVIPVIVETRYRYPFFPFLAIFAALAYVLFRQKEKNLAIKRFLLGTFVFLVLISLFDAARNIGLIADKLSGLF